MPCTNKNVSESVANEFAVKFKLFACCFCCMASLKSHTHSCRIKSGGCYDITCNKKQFNGVAERASVCLHAATLQCNYSQFSTDCL